MRRLVVFAAAFIALTLGSLELVAAGGGCMAPAGATEGKGVEVKVAHCSFSPTIIHAPIGATVTWFNGDYLPHAINGLGWNATEPFKPANPGTVVSYQFAVAGIYPYMCYVHPGMSGIVVVGDVALNPNADGAQTTPLIAPQAANAGSVAAASPSAALAVEAPLAIALTLVGAVAGYALAHVRRYRWLGGALAIRRRDGVHAR